MFEKTVGKGKKNREMLASTENCTHPNRTSPGTPPPVWVPASGPTPPGPNASGPHQFEAPLPFPHPGDAPENPPETPEPPRRPLLDPQGGGVGWRGGGSGWKCPKGGFEGGALKGGFEGVVLALSGKKRKTWPKSTKLSMIFFFGLSRIKDPIAVGLSRISLSRMGQT